MKTVYVASTSKHKISELRQMLAPQGYDVSDLTEFADYIPPEEAGTTFLENARIKARALCDFLNKHFALHKPRLTILADDSGLECDDLDGAPGVYSARYSGANASDTENNSKLISEIGKLQHPTHTARYVCALIFLTPDGAEKSIVETCEGQITFDPKGKNGFGYDPHFYLPELGKTMAELSPEEKNRISHRGKALKRLLAVLT